MGHRSIILLAFCIVLVGGVSARGSDNWFETGVGYLKAREFDSAIQAFSRALETIPDDYEAYNNRGVAHSQLNHLERAVADFNRALSLNPQYKAALLNRGISYRRQGRIAAAIKDYHRLISTAPDYIKAYQNLSWILATCPDGRFRDGSRALALIKMAEKQDPRIGMADNWAAALAEIGDFKGAAQRQRSHVEQIRANAAQAVLSEERYWLERYGRGQARREHYRVSDGNGEAAEALKLIADLVPRIPLAGAKKAKPASVEKPATKPKPRLPARSVALGTPQVRRYSVQVGSYSRGDSALEVVGDLRRHGHPAFAFKVVLANGKTWYRVLVGCYTTPAEAKAVAQGLRKVKFPHAFEVVARYGVAIKKVAANRSLSPGTRKLLLSRGFYPYLGPGNRWLVGAYTRKAEARIMARELMAAGVAVEMVGL